MVFVSICEHANNVFVSVSMGSDQICLVSSYIQHKWQQQALPKPSASMILYFIKRKLLFCANLSRLHLCNRTTDAILGEM